MIALRVVLVLTLFLGLSGGARAQVNLDLSEGDGSLITLPSEAAAVFVADPGVADAQATSGRTIYVSGITPGRTSIIALDFEDAVIEEYVITVRARNDDAEALVSGGGRVQSRGNVAVLRGNASGVEGALAAAAAADSLRSAGRVVVDQSTVAGGTQIQLRVRFVEASRRELRQLGIDLAAFNSDNAIRFVTGLGDPTGFLEGGASAGAALGGRATVGGVTVDALIDALETRGLVQILSEPTLTTVSGRRATFQAGGEIAFPVNQGDGVISAAFKPFGVSIDFLPTLLPNGRIAIEVTPEVSFIDSSAAVQVEGFSAPGLSVRRAQTTVEVGSGQTFAIAGLYQRTASSDSSGLPGLRRVLGRNVANREERELSIFITPYLAEASDAASPRAPQPDIADTIGFILK